MECAFKRITSLLHFDQLRAFDLDIAQMYLLAIILGALLADSVRNPETGFFPLRISPPTGSFPLSGAILK